MNIQNLQKLLLLILVLLQAISYKQTSLKQRNSKYLLQAMEVCNSPRRNLELTVCRYWVQQLMAQCLIRKAIPLDYIV